MTTPFNQKASPAIASRTISSPTPEHTLDKLGSQVHALRKTGNNCSELASDVRTFKTFCDSFCHSFVQRVDRHSNLFRPYHTHQDLVKTRSGVFARVTN